MSLLHLCLAFGCCVGNVADQRKDLQKDPRNGFCSENTVFVDDTPYFEIGSRPDLWFPNKMSMEMDCSSSKPETKPHFKKKTKISPLITKRLVLFFLSLLETMSDFFNLGLSIYRADVLCNAPVMFGCTPQATAGNKLS